MKNHVLKFTSTGSRYSGLTFLLLFFVFQFSKASLQDSLKLHYNFNQVLNDSIVPDASGNGYFGVLKGATVGMSNGKNSIILGTSGLAYMDMGAKTGKLISTLHDFTMSTYIWVNETNNNLSNYGNFIAVFANSLNSAANRDGYAIFHAKSSRYAISPTNYVTEYATGTGADVEKGKWVHLTYTQTGNTGKFYVDGKLANTNNNVPMTPSELGETPYNFLVKPSYVGDSYLQDAQLSDFRIYNRAVSDNEILMLNGYPESLVLAYEALNISGDLLQIQSNISLPVQSGPDNIPVVWTSSNPNVISTTGIVNQPVSYDANITLTASLNTMIDGKTYLLKKDFNIVVLAKSSEISHWESIVLENDTWKYLRAVSPPPATWYQSGFDASLWTSAQGGIGLGDNDDNTIITSCNSVYMRREINIPDTLKIENIVLDIDYDDAFVLYINGVEAARSNNVTGAFPAYNANLTTDHEAKMYSGGSPERFQLKPSSLKTGLNTFAVHILNRGIGSSDISSRVFIHAKFKSTGINYHEVPTWFQEPKVFDSSNLPLISINTNGQNIIQNTKINVDMKVLNNPDGINLLSDTTYEFNGKAGIEIRGFSSSGFPKKSYTLETRTDSATNFNVSLLGLPKENDWVFHGPYSDKSLMRNVLAYNLGNKTGKWSPRTRYFELLINGNYEGVYVLVEKIKIDKNRVNIATLNAADTIGDQLTGGYVMKIDRPEATDIENVDYWFSPYRAWTDLQQRVPFIFQDPKGSELQPQQRAYMRALMSKFEDAMYSDNYQDRIDGYYPLIDLKSFVDYYIITELSRNLDGYRVSTFFHKDKDSKGGKLTMGPFWDYNICFGNSNFFSAGSTEGWVIDGMGNADAYAMPFWWEKFRLDPYFNSHLKIRWNELKDQMINTTYINNLIDSCAYELKDASVRNFQTWNVLGSYVWPNNYVGGTYANELNYLRNWMKDRIDWMDSQIQPIVDITVKNITTETFPMEIVTYPNPFVDEVNFKFYMNDGGKVDLIVRDLMGRIVYTHEENYTPGLHLKTLHTHEFTIKSQVYVYQMLVDGKTRTTGKLIQQ